MTEYASVQAELEQSLRECEAIFPAIVKMPKQYEWYDQSEIEKTLAHYKTTFIENYTHGYRQLYTLHQWISEWWRWWQHWQKMSQIGAPFENRDQQLAALKDQRGIVIELGIKLVKIANNMSRTLPKSTPPWLELQQLQLQCYKILEKLVSQSFPITNQPEPVMKIGAKLKVELAFLVTENLNVDIGKARVRAKIVTAEEAYNVMHGSIAPNDAKPMGLLSNQAIVTSVFEQHDDLCCIDYDNTKLTAIENRNKRKTVHQTDTTPADAYTIEDPFCLLFVIDSLVINGLQFRNICTATLPFIVIKHNNQECVGDGAAFWLYAFTEVNEHAIGQPSWPELATALKWKFSQAISQPGQISPRTLNEDDLNYLKGLLNIRDDNERITRQRFTKEQCEALSFPFWKWFYAILQLIKQHLFHFWDQSWLIGFIGKEEAAQKISSHEDPSLLLRFSNSVLGSVSVTFQTMVDGCYVSAHVEPWDMIALIKMPLHERLASCQYVQNIRFLHPNIDISTVYRFFEELDKQTSKRSPPLAVRTVWGYRKIEPCLQLPELQRELDSLHFSRNSPFSVSSSMHSSISDLSRSRTESSATTCSLEDYSEPEAQNAISQFFPTEIDDLIEIDIADADFL